MSTPRILICNSQVPFTKGGAELLVESLERELIARDFEVETVQLPAAWTPRAQVLKSALAWRLLDVGASPTGKIDLVIATRFPSYLIKHPNKVVWLVHQFRQVYDLLGTRYSDFSSSPEDKSLVETVHRLDRRALAEARALFTISLNTAARLERYLSLSAEPLYPPSPIGAHLSSGEYGDYVLGVGRLDEIKRFGHLVDAIAETGSPVRALIVGVGPEEEKLKAKVQDLGLDERVTFLGRVDDERLAELYSGALAVYYAPFDEDYGYVTVEAFLAERPVVTTGDAGGVLEFVEDQVNGFVAVPGRARAMGACIDQLWNDRALAAKLGRAGRERVVGVGWDRVIERLTATL